MKICAFFRGRLHQDYVILKPTDSKDLDLVKKMFASKTEREHRNNSEILLECEIDCAFHKRTFKQLRAVWKLVEVIFMNDSENHRKPTQEEKYELYLDLLDVYGDKKPNRFKQNSLRNVHISESDTMQASRFIESLLYHISTQCDLPTDLQATVRSVLYQWQIWRGKQEVDINDNRNIDDLREMVRYSEASGRCERLELAHIVSRGADYADIEESWNIIVLTHDEHRQVQHQHGWDTFLEMYPHLRGRVEKARELAGKLPLQKKQTTKELAELVW